MKRKVGNQRLARLKLKEEVLTYYGNGKCACVKCGHTTLASLSIDHINGKGSREKREKGIGNYYAWLKKEGYPSGYQTLCMNCQFVKREENHELKACYGARWTGDKYPAYIGVRISRELHSALRSRANEKGKIFSEYLRDCLGYIVKQTQNTTATPFHSVHKKEGIPKPVNTIEPVARSVHKGAVHTMKDVLTDKDGKHYKLIGGVRCRIKE